MTSQNKNLTEFILPSITPNTLVLNSVNSTNQLPQAIRWNISTSNTESKYTIWNESLIASMSRSYSIWNVSSNPYNWCHGPEIETNSGLLFVKVNKCASSTGMGVTLRIADTLGRRLQRRFSSLVTDTTKNDTTTMESKACFARYNHGWASTEDRRYQYRSRERSVLWSIIRHPASRVVSDYFFYEASRRNRHVTEARILRHVQNSRFQTHYVNYLRLMEANTTIMTTTTMTTDSKATYNYNRIEEISHIIQNYDFLAISERMDESLVVLSMLWRLPLADLIVLPSKEAGGYDDGRSRKGCVKLKKKWTTPKIDDYLKTDFLKDNYDYLLYQIANASLDQTIDTLGRDNVHRGVQLFRTLMKKNEQECRGEAIFPCPIQIPNQTKLAEEDCYFSDAGCGHKCTDRALRGESEHQWSTLISAIGENKS